MIIPIRCWSCGKPIAQAWEEFAEAKEKNQSLKKVLDKLGIERYCCRRMLLTTVETIQQVIPFYEAIQKRKEEVQSELE